MATAHFAYVHACTWQMGLASLLWSGQIRQDRGQVQPPTPSTTGKLRESRGFALSHPFCIWTGVSEVFSLSLPWVRLQSH